MISFNNLELQNFLSHRNTNLPLSEYEGLVLIEGITSEGHYNSNGAGKSTLLEGILYALTGDTLRGVAVNDVVNRNYGKDTHVSLQFNKDKDSYEIIRYRKDKVNGDAIVLKANGDDISKRVNKETQKSIDDLLGISYKVLVSTMLLGEGLSSKFTQLSDADKKSLIESTLSLDADVSSARAKANSCISQLKLSIAEIEGKLSIIRNLTSIDVDGERSKLEELAEKKVNLSNQIHLESEKLQALQQNYKTINQKLTLIRSALSQYDTLSAESSRLDSEAAGYVREIKKVESSEIPHCNLCHQPLSSEEAKNFVIDSYKSLIEERTQKMRDIQSQIASMPQRSILEEKYKSLIDESNSIDASVKEVMNNVMSMNNQVSQIESEINSIEKTLENVAKNSGDMESLENEMSSLVREKSKYEYFYTLFSPTGIINTILSDAIEYINDRLSVYSSVLLDKEYKLKFNKGKIALVDNSGASYQSLSNGEKKRLDVAIQFSLHDYCMIYCGLRVDKIFIDEILDTVDDTGIDNIFDVLRLKIDYCGLKSIFVITHNNTLKDKFDQVITIFKDSNGDSYLKKN